MSKWHYEEAPTVRYFVLPSVEQVAVRTGRTFVNKPVNLRLCLSLRKETEHSYDGYSIVFFMVDEVQITWLYDRAKDRDDDYARIINEKA